MINEEKLRKSILDSDTWANVCRLMNVKPRTGSQSHLKTKAEKLKIDFSHFVGQSHAKGKISSKRTSAIEYLNTTQNISSHRLKIKLIRDGVKEEKCEQCNISEWQGEKIPLELDHIDNDHFNNELSNLKILCPNCHSIKTRKERKKIPV